MAQTRARKAPGAGKATTKAPGRRSAPLRDARPGARGPAAKAARGHDHPPLSDPGKLFAEELARVALRTLYAGATHNAEVLQRMKAAGKYTREFQAFETMRMPPEVVAWIRKNCWPDGVVRRAVASELAQGLWHAQATRADPRDRQYAAAPDHLKPAPEDQFDPEHPGPAPDQTTPPYSCCTPFCGTP